MKQILLHANLKRHRGSLLGIGFLVFLSVLLFTAVLSVGSAGARTEDEELSRLGYGNLTAWVSGNEKVLSGLADELESQDSVAQASIQPLVFPIMKSTGRNRTARGSWYSMSRIGYRTVFLMGSCPGTGKRRKPSNLEPCICRHPWFPCTGLQQEIPSIFPLQGRGMEFPLRWPDFLRIPLWEAL